MCSKVYLSTWFKVLTKLTIKEVKTLESGHPKVFISFYLTDVSGTWHRTQERLRCEVHQRCGVLVYFYKKTFYF